jgi:HPt (histidine-containing phosphotransfer) domain-containing protein
MEIPKASQLKYIQRRLDELDFLKTSLSEGNFEPAIRIGHQLKGNAVTFGFAEFQKIGEELEFAAINKDLSESLNQLENIFICATQKLNVLNNEGDV